MLLFKAFNFIHSINKMLIHMIHFLLMAKTQTHACGGY